MEEVEQQRFPVAESMAALLDIRDLLYLNALFLCRGQNAQLADSAMPQLDALLETVRTRLGG